MPVVPWVDVARGRMAAGPAGVQRRIADFAAGLADPRVVVKPARLGSSRRHLDRPQAPRSPSTPAARIDRGLRLRRLGAGRGVPRAPARARDERRRQLGARPRELRAGRDLPGPRVLRLQRQVQRGRLAHDRPTRGRRRRSSRSCTTRPARPTWRSAPPASRASTSCSPSDGGLYLNEINTIPGFTPISLFPRPVPRGRLRLRRHLRADRRARASSAQPVTPRR